MVEGVAADIQPGVARCVHLFPDFIRAAGATAAEVLAAHDAGLLQRREHRVKPVTVGRGGPAGLLTQVRVEDLTHHPPRMWAQDCHISLIAEQIDNRVDYLVWGLETGSDVAPDGAMHRIEESREVTGSHQATPFGRYILVPCPNDSRPV